MTSLTCITKLGYSTLLALATACGLIACASRVLPDGGDGLGTDARSVTDGLTTDTSASCPSQPQLSGPCALQSGTTCSYGAQTYSAAGCGGRVTVCNDGQWSELFHTDPGPDCPYARPDAGSADRDF